MSWASEAIFWHLYPLRFVDAEAAAIDHVEHRLWRITNYLDYAIALGANGLLLAPMFASATHGYDTLDHLTIDPRLGDDADFDDLLWKAHERGFKVVLDGVFNHLDRSHALVQRALASGPGTPDGDWIRWSGDYPYCFEGSENLVELNLANPAVQGYVADAMNHWLDRGIDGWRLDAAYAAGAESWTPIVRRVRARHPDAWLLGEVLHGDYAAFVAASGVDTVTQYELWKAIWSSLNDANLYELAHALKRHDEMLETFLPQTFVGNHDVTRIATQLTDPRDVELAAALLLLLPGTPSIYAGDEQGFTGEKVHAPNGDDAVRPPFPIDPSGLAPFGRDVLDTYRHLISVRRQNPWIATARVEVCDLSNTAMTVALTGRDGQRATLALNCGNSPVQLPGAHGPLRVGAHSWQLG